jgi:hypothetical protein
VDGDLCELDEATLARLRGEVAEVDMSTPEYRAMLADKRVPQIGIMANVKRHAAQQEAQRALRETIAWWAGFQRAQARPDSESYRRFYHKFGVDVLTAQALGTAQAIELQEKINLNLQEVCR